MYSLPFLVRRFHRTSLRSPGTFSLVVMAIEHTSVSSGCLLDVLIDSWRYYQVIRHFVLIIVDTLPYITTVSKES